MKKIVIFSFAFLSLTACNVSNISTENSETKPLGEPDKTVNTIDLGNMDKTIKPSEDFFQFANGTWIKNNPVPSSETSWGSFNELETRNNIALTKILKEAASAGAQKGSDNQLLGDYYTSSSNMRARNEKGNKPLLDRLEMIQNIKSRNDLLNVIAKQHSLGIGSFFSFGVDQDLIDVNKHMAYIGQGGIGLPNKDFYFDENKTEVREAYRIFMKDLFVLSGLDEKSAILKAQNAYNFEINLAKNMLSQEEMRDPFKTYNVHSWSEFTEMISGIEIEGYFTQIGCQKFDTIIVGQPEFLKGMNDIFQSKSIEEWQDYLMWCSMNHYAGSLDANWEKRNFDFFSGTLRGQKEMKPVDERVIDELTGSVISEVLGKAFIKDNFSQEAKTRVNLLVDNLLISFQSRINALEWMTPETKKEALNKLNSIGRKLGFPDKWEDFTAIDISKENYIQNLDNLAKYATQKQLAKLYKPVDKKEWGMPAHMVNAYYHPLMNEIAFPAGIMQPPFFDINAEDAVNYGRIGMVIGHEFTHGFDDFGSQFAADGSLRNWWGEDDRTKFEARTKTLGETFAQFCPIEGHCVKPELTMGENIADLGGLTMAFYAYKMTPEFKAGKIVNGYTPAQRFFIAYAQLWKVNFTEAELKNRIATDSHSPGMFRVNGPLKNCPEFFEAFGIKEGDKMRNPKDKIAKIW